MPLPNAVIIGAPKCGTTSLFAWLSAHPEVGGATVKETFYLMDQTSCEFQPHANVHQHGLERYAACFRSHRHHKVVLEATSGYLYQETARRVLADLPTAPRLIVVLRQPAHRLYSTYQYFPHHKAALDPQLSFTTFVEMVRRGAAELHGNEFLYDAIRHSQYVDYLERWRDACGAARLHLILFERLCQEPQVTMQRLAAWLHIDPVFYQDYTFQQFNESYRVKHHAIHKLIRRVVLPLAPPRLGRDFLRRLYVRLNGDATRVTKTAQDNATLAQLETYFRPFNERLARAFGVDLTPWYARSGDRVCNSVSLP